jgi:simple sugar transport system ATP-binding protein
MTVVSLDTRAASPHGVPLLDLRGLTKRFGDVRALEEVSLAIAAGEIRCLLGENGAGKSTLCNLIFGLYQPDAGDMLLADAPYQPHGPGEALAAGVATVHQHFSLVPNLSVLDNLILGREHGLLHRRAYAAKIVALASEYGLPLDPSAIVDEMSVGERQRVEIIKCLMRSPRLVVLDEPTAVLPPDEVDAFLGVCRHVADAGCAVVLVTHKLAEIKRVADRVTVLRHGRVVAHSDDPLRDIDRLVRAMI